MRLVSDEPDVVGEQPLVSRLRAVIAAKDEQVSVLQARLGAALARLDAAVPGLEASPLSWELTAPWLASLCGVDRHQAEQGLGFGIGT